MSEHELRPDAKSEREGLERQVVADATDETRGQALEQKFLPPATHQRLESGEIVPLEQAPLASNPMEMVARALEMGIDGPMLQQFMDLQERHEDREARRAYAADMVKAQKAMPAVIATSENEQTSSLFAKLGVIINAIKPIYTKYGFSVSFGEGVAAKENEIRITARVMHRFGHSEDFFYDLELDTVGPKGAVNKTPIHGKGSSTSYAQRYLTKMIWNVAILEEDDDGNAAGGAAPGRVTEEQAMELDALVSENELNHTAIQREFRVAGWPQIPANKFDKVKDRILQLIQARKGQR